MDGPVVPRGHRPGGPGRHRARRLSPVRSLRRGGPQRRADRIRAAADRPRPAVDVDSRRLLPRPWTGRRRPRLSGELCRRRPAEAPRARGRLAGASAAPGDRQRRLADRPLRPAAQDPLREPAVRRLDRRRAGRPARPRRPRARRRRHVRGHGRAHPARLRRGEGLVRAARAQGDGRAPLGPRHALSGSRGRRPGRRRLRGDDGHRGRHRHSRRVEGAGGAASAHRRQHPRSDRLPRSRVDVHVRQPGVRELGPPAARRDLRQDAVRSAGPRRRVVPAPDPGARAGRRARRVRARSTARPTASSAGSTGASPRTSTRTDRCAGSIAPSTTSTTSS